MLQEQTYLKKLSLTSKAFVHGTLEFFKDEGIEKINIDELYNCEEYYLEKGYMFKEIQSIEEIIEQDEEIKEKEGNIFIQETISKSIIRKCDKTELYHVLKEYCQKFFYEAPTREKIKCLK